MNTNDALLAERIQNIPQGSFFVHPIFVKEAKGAIVVDVEGRQYLDFATGIGVCAIGHRHEKVMEAIQGQIQKYLHTCFHVVMYEPYVELAKRLNKITPGNFLKKTLFASGGAESVENAIKIARHATGRPAIIAIEHAFHGRTLLASSLTSKVHPYKEGYAPYAPEIYRIPCAYCYRCTFGLEYPSCKIKCAHHLKEFFKTHVSSNQVAALIAEPVFGEGGFIVPPKEYFKIIYEICHENGILFIADEIQSGFGRTGKMFAIEHYEVEPDLVVTGKALAGGLPLSAVTGKAELMDHPQVGGLGGTYAGNPVSCSAAIAVIDVFNEEPILEQAEEIGRIFLDRFKKLQNEYPFIGEVRGLGAMVAMELVLDRKTKEPATELTRKLINTCRSKGLLMISAGTYSNTIRTLMPLNLTQDEIERGLSIIEESLEELGRSE